MSIDIEARVIRSRVGKPRPVAEKHAKQIKAQSRYTVLRAQAQEAAARDAKKRGK
jgi:hypothetical protein